MIVIFDLDYTLLDTKAFKEGIVAAISAHGPSIEEVREAQEGAMNRNPDGTGYYDPDLHIRLLLHRFVDKRIADDAREAIEDVIRHTDEYLYPGAADLLHRLHAKGIKLVLITFGNKQFQMRKVKQSGIDKMFDEVIATLEDKGKVLHKFVGDEDVVVVNDNGVETMAMREVEPSFRYIVKKGPKGLPENVDLPVVESFEEVERFILGG